MIISHKYKYIFIKPAKVAGTSVQHALAESCGEQDIVTRTGNLNLDEDGTNHLDISQNSEGYNSHMPPDKIRNKIGEEIWNSYYKFTIVRNPWDMFVSRYYQQKALPRRFLNRIKRGTMNILGINNQPWKFPKNFPDCLENFKETWINDQHYFDENGEAICDFYIRYENLEEDYRKVCEHLGIPYKQLPRIKTDTRTDRSHYSILYNEETKKIVEDKCKRQIETFGYKFEKKH